MERYLKGFDPYGYRDRYDDCTNEELVKIYNKLQDQDVALLLEIFWRIDWDYDEVFHTKDENFNDNLLDVDGIIQKALSELLKLK